MDNLKKNLRLLKKSQSHIKLVYIIITRNNPPESIKDGYVVNIVHVDGIVVSLNSFFPKKF